MKTVPKALIKSETESLSRLNLQSANTHLIFHQAKWHGWANVCSHKGKDRPDWFNTRTKIKKVKQNKNNNN